MIVNSFNNPLYQEQTYVLSQENYPAAIIIDPGNSDISEIRNFLRSKGKSVGHIVLTHEHFDHIAGVKELRREYECQLICSLECSKAITDSRKNYSRYLTGVDFVCPPADITCESLNGILKWNESTLRFLITPGHSPGSICIAVEMCLFAGDTLIRDIPTVTKFPGGDKTALRHSINTIMEEMDKNTKIFPGHGKEFYLRDVRLEAVLGLDRTLGTTSLED